MNPEPNIYCIQTTTGIQYGHFDIYIEKKSSKVILNIGGEVIVLHPYQIEQLKLDVSKLQTK